MKKASPATENRALKREIRNLTLERNSIKVICENYRRRAMLAESDRAEWKQRFDLLLARTPETKP